MNRKESTVSNADRCRTMTQHTSRLCKDYLTKKESDGVMHSRLYKGYLTKKESDGVLHQLTWPPQSPDLNPIEMVWDELDRRVEKKQPT
uniref:Tc1-like transposase DDE domain-containing protein n=1 Tax=Hucho hucho TaxID=62062 RepID=A0A4W5NFI6_9TELE